MPSKLILVRYPKIRSTLLLIFICPSRLHWILLKLQKNRIQRESARKLTFLRRNVPALEQKFNFDPWSVWTVGRSFEKPFPTQSIISSYWSRFPIDPLKGWFPSPVPPFESSIVKQYYIDFENIRYQSQYKFFLPIFCLFNFKHLTNKV